MAHIEGQAPLSKPKDVHVSGVSNIGKLEAMLKEEETLLKEAEDNIAALQECFNRYNQAVSLKWNSRKMVRKVKAKLSNLQRVKKEDFKLNTWFSQPEYHGHNTYIYPLRTTPAGRVEVIEFTGYKERHNWNWRTGKDEGYTGPYWAIRVQFMDSAELQRVAPLTILVTVGNLNKLLKTFMDTDFYKQFASRAYSDYVHMDIKDTGDANDFEVLDQHPKSKAAATDED